MVLSNAERQARHRARLKAKASGEALAERAREAAGAAVAALWVYFTRENYGDIAGCDSQADYARTLADAESGGLVATCRAALDGADDALPEEIAAIQLVVDIADAIALSDLKADISRSRRRKVRAV